MTTKGIEDQIRMIRAATQKASTSKEGAVAFLAKAGIINPIAKPQKAARTDSQEPQ